MRDKNKIIRVDFRDETTGKPIGYTELPWGQIPGQFRDKPGIKVKGGAFTIVSAKPSKQKDWLSGGWLILTLKAKDETAKALVAEALVKKTEPAVAESHEEEPITLYEEPITLYDPPSQEPVKAKEPEPAKKQPLVRAADTTSIPRSDAPPPPVLTCNTRSGYLPRSTGIPASSDNVIVMMASEWRQIELIGKDQLAFLEAELDALKVSPDLYIRLAIRLPLGSQFTVAEFISAVMPDAIRTEGICFQGDQEIAEDSFGLRGTDGMEAYGAEVAGFVFALGFRKFPLPAEAQRKLAAFMQTHQLVLIHWIRARAITPSELL